MNSINDLGNSKENYQSFCALSIKYKVWEQEKNKCEKMPCSAEEIAHQKKKRNETLAKWLLLLPRMPGQEARKTTSQKKRADLRIQGPWQWTCTWGIGARAWSHVKDRHGRAIAQQHNHEEAREWYQAGSHRMGLWFRENKQESLEFLIIKLTPQPSC